jgi:hypothetical protein
MSHLLRAWRWSRTFFGNDVVFLSTMTAAFAGVISERLDWALFAGFVMFAILVAIHDAVDTILDELRKAGVLPRKPEADK